MSVVGMTYTFPFGTNDAFPDNGLLNLSYDSRVSQNDMLNVGRELMHECEAYITEEHLDGTLIYNWNVNFIANVQKSLSENKIANFSKAQRKLFDAYNECRIANDFTTAAADVVALNDKINSM